MFEPIYSLPLSLTANGDYKAGEVGSGGGVLMPLGDHALGTGYSDMFRRQRAPTMGELFTHLCGAAYRCANLNSNLLAATRLRLYLLTRKGDPKAKFVKSAEANGRCVTARVPIKRIKSLQNSPAGKSALLDAVESGDSDVEEVTQHPILDVLRKPEDTQNDGGLSAYDFRWLTQIHMEVPGVAYWYIAERDGMTGNPTRLQVLRPQLVRPIPDPSGEKYYLRYEYGSAKLAVKDVIRFGIPDPSNGHYGVLSPMRAAIEKIKLSRGGDAFMGALLENGGYPMGVISPKDEGGVIGPQEAKRIQNAFKSGYAMNNIGRLLVMGTSGVELKTLAWKPVEIVDAEKARDIIGEIADCFDVPRTMFFRDSANKGSSDSGDDAHPKMAGIPRCSRFEEVLNGQFVPLFDKSDRLFLAFDSPVPNDKAFELEQTKTGGQLGILTINQGLASLGAEQVEGELGDCRLVPSTSVLLKPDGSTIQLTPEPTPEPGAPKPAKKPKPKKSRDAALAKVLKELAKAIQSERKQDDDPSEIPDRSGRVDAEKRQAVQGVRGESIGTGNVAVTAPIECVGSAYRNENHDQRTAESDQRIAIEDRRDSAVLPDVISRLIANGYTEADARAKIEEKRKETL